MSPLSRAFVLGLLLIVTTSAATTTITTTTSDSFLYAGCSPTKCNSGSQFESNLNSLITSLVSFSSSSSFANLTVGAAHGLYQCRPDNPDCPACISSCASQIETACPYSLSAALLLDGCYIRYANASFLGIEDKTLVLKNCGPGQLDSSSDQTSNRNTVLNYLLSSGGQQFTATSDGDIKGVAECVVGLSPAQCQDCLEEAIGLLKTECWYSSSGDAFLATCYARYAATASPAASIPNEGKPGDAGIPKEGKPGDGGTQKTFAIIIGIVAVIGIIVIVAVIVRKFGKDDFRHHRHCHK